MLALSVPFMNDMIPLTIYRSENRSFQRDLNAVVDDRYTHRDLSR